MSIVPESDISAEKGVFGMAYWENVGFGIRSTAGVLKYEIIFYTLCILPCN